MDSKSFIEKNVKKAGSTLKARRTFRITFDAFCIALAAAVVFEIIALFVPVFSEWIYGVGIIAAGILTGLIIGIIKKKDYEKAAIYIDSFGLDERVVTAYENRDNNDTIYKVQREDAARKLSPKAKDIKYPIGISRKKWLIAAGLLVCFAVLIFIPTESKMKAKEKHVFDEDVKEKVEDIKDVKDAIKSIDQTDLSDE